MLLFYVRHGHPTYDPDCLTEAGHAEAEALVCRMKRVNPDKIFASTSTRAIQTAEPTAKALGKEITTLDWCNEGHAWRDFSVFKEDGSGRTWAFHNKAVNKLLASKEVREMGENWHTHPDLIAAGIGSAERVKAETYAFLESLGYRHTEEGGYEAIAPTKEKIALFAHQGFGLGFLSAVLDIPYPTFCTHFDMTYTGMTVIEFAGDGFVVPRLLQLSNDSHLFASDMETVYNNTYEF